jgi:hypothetical protein
MRGGLGPRRTRLYVGAGGANPPSTSTDPLPDGLGGFNTFHFDKSETAERFCRLPIPAVARHRRRYIDFGSRQTI